MEDILVLILGIDYEGLGCECARGVGLIIVEI